MAHKNIPPDLTNFLSKCIDDSSLNDIIYKSEDKSVLKTALAVKTLRMEKYNSKLHYPMKNLLDQVSADNEICGDTLEILEMLLLVHDDNSEYEVLIDFISSTLSCCTENNFNLLFNLLVLLIKSTNNSERKNEVTGKYLIFLRDYLELLENSGNVCKLIWELIKNSDNLEILCYLHKYFSQSSSFELFELDEYWAILQFNISASNSHKQKLALFLVVTGVDTIKERNTNFQTPSGVMNWNCANSEKLSQAWANFCLLLEVSREKQLHLVEPSLPFLKTIDVLHPSWLMCIYNIFLKHMQAKVVSHTLKVILKQNWYISNGNTFKSVTNDILLALNKNNSFEDVSVVFDELQYFMRNLAENRILELFQECLNVNWIPGVLLYFYKNTIHNYNYVSSSLLPIITELLIQAGKLPHKFIRSGCIKILLQYADKNVKDLEFDRYIQILMNLSEEYLFKYAVETLKLDESFIIFNLKQEIDGWKEGVDSNRIKVILKLVEYYSVELNTILIKHFNSVNLQNTAKDLLFAYLTNKFIEEGNSKLVTSYILNRLKIINSEENVFELIRVVEKLQASHFQQEIIKELLRYSVEIIKNPDEYNNNQISLSFTVYNTFRTGQKCDPIVAIWTCKFKQITKKYDFYTCKNFCKIFFEEFSNVGELEKSAYLIIKIFVDTQSSEVCNILIGYLPKLFENAQNTEEFLNCIHLILNFIVNMKRTSNFKDILTNFIDTIVVMLTQNIIVDNLLEILRKLLDFAKTYENCANILAATLKKEFFNVSYTVQQLLVPIIVDLLLFCNTLMKKCDRLEYEACKEIFLDNTQTTESGEHIFNWKQDVKLSVFEIFINLKRSARAQEISNEFVSCLVGKYQVTFKKRYFPDSQIHIQKLRTFQALLVLNELLNNEEKHNLLKFLLNSVDSESHQVCVKQLIQFLIIRITVGRLEWCNELREKLESTSKNLSVQTTLIPVIFHITKNRDESFLVNVVRYLLKLTMGPQFALRLYSQVAFAKIYESSLTNPEFKNFHTNFSAVYTSIKEILDEYGTQLETTLHKNRLVFDLNHNEDFTLETILVVIPKLNGVSVREWELAEFFVKAKKGTSTIKISNGETSKIREFLETTRLSPKPLEIGASVQFSANIQKKILPWKTVAPMEEVLSTKELIVVTSLIKSAANIGGLTRTCEIFKVRQLVVCDKQIVSESEYRNLSMSSEGWVDICEVKEPDLSDFILDMKSKGYAVVGVEQTSNSTKLNDYDFPNKLVVILGNEKQGITPNLIPILDICVEIPQLGMTRSLNVHVAGAIIIWEYTKQHILNKIK